MDKIDLFKSLLNKEFWNGNKHRLTPDLFPDLLQDLYESLVATHAETDKDLSCRDLYNTHLSLNPTLTASNRAIVVDLLKQVNEVESLGQDIAQFVLNKALVETKANSIARIALEIAQGKHEDWDSLDKLLSTDVTKDELHLVTTDIKQLFIDKDLGFKWDYNLPELARLLGKVGPGMLNVLAAPVNAGKSALAVSFVAAPGGFLEQGARVLYIGNEESMQHKTMPRVISANTGMTELEVIDDMARAQQIFDKVRKNLLMVQDYGMTFNRLNHIIDKERPDIVVLDMLDKVGVSKSYQREDQRLGAIYEQARESAKRYDTCVFGLSQTDAKSFGKLYYSFDRLHGSKVEKGANADTVITIGAQSGDFNSDVDNNFRVLNIAKSKNDASGKKIQCQIVPSLSRFRP